MNFELLLMNLLTALDLFIWVLLFDDDTKSVFSIIEFENCYYLIVISHLQNVKFLEFSIHLHSSFINSSLRHIHAKIARSEILIYKKNTNT